MISELVVNGRERGEQGGVIIGGDGDNGLTNQGTGG